MYDLSSLFKLHSHSLDEIGASGLPSWCRSINQLKKQDFKFVCVSQDVLGTAEIISFSNGVKGMGL